MIRKKVAIIDYGVGNLFSVRQACESAGMNGFITSSSQDILNSEAVILPGVGAFGSAMASLTSSGLVPVIEHVAASGKPLLGICLGMQLLLEKSCEFGESQGLGIIKGEVVRLGSETAGMQGLPKVPHVGWNRIEEPAPDAWKESYLKANKSDDYMYFVHSYYSVPADERIVLSMTNYKGIKFCSSFQVNNIFGCQFHPEKSGPGGIEIYKTLSLLT